MERFRGKEPGPCETGSVSNRKTGIAGDDELNDERRRWREDFMIVGDFGGVCCMKGIFCFMQQSYIMK